MIERYSAEKINSRGEKRQRENMLCKFFQKQLAKENSEGVKEE